METWSVWLKTIHIGTLVFWSAGLLYLPALFAAHGRSLDRSDFHRLRAQTRLTYVGIVSPAAVIAIASGTALIYTRTIDGGWLPLKLTVVALMVFLHLADGWLLSRHRVQGVTHHPVLLGGMIAAPALFIPTVLWLVIAKPV